MLRINQNGVTIMVAGAVNLGKSSFINTLFDQEIANVENENLQIGSLSVYVVETEYEGLKKTVTIIDTPGFGENIDDTNIHENIRNYIKAQFDAFLTEESKIRRNPYFEDTRIHCLLYFLAPNVHGLTSNDIEFLKSVENLINIIPVVGKADGLTIEELTELRKKVMSQIKLHKIKIFKFEREPMNKSLVNNELHSKIPFSIITSESVGGEESFRGRKFPWGLININDPQNCDFKLVKEILFSYHIDLLAEKTITLLYEDYREVVLSENFHKE